ncbi:hypothetical protein AB8P72_03490 [Psychrobacter sp. CLB018]|uniref:hypothetical protein n=1 Tax=Psychrobacter sp. CLB018 TaxID=3240930 RepID=UPI0035161CA2
MSDFLFCRNEQAIHQLAKPLKDLMPEPELVKVEEYSGTWGALAVTLGPYNGFAPYEDESHICVVIGGPVLYWRDNHFLTNAQQPTEATQAILQRWQSGAADWSEDLSGPFVILIVNKNTAEIFCYTDLMTFIPVYQYLLDISFCLGTHVDTVAKIANQNKNVDEVSVADFILHSIVTYPHTLYSNLFQLAPATEHRWLLNNSKNIEQRTPYWEPLEINSYKNINEAAIALRIGLAGYIERITETMTEVGQFISAGEDSRSVAGLLPERLKRDAYIYVDSKNREFKLAKRVSDAYGCEFNYILRSPTHYLDILPKASKLVGNGQQYTNAHTLGLAKQSGADKKLAVFGGFLSDTLLKAHHSKKNKTYKRFYFLPEFFIKGTDRTISNNSLVFGSNILEEINKRRAIHYSYVSSLRKDSAYEWFNVWPITMHVDFPNITVNRRLFPSYEVFTSKDVVKVSAMVPTQWKLNRKLFHKALKPALKASKLIPHGDGRLPYYPWYLNSFLQLPRWNKRVFNKALNVKKVDGSWTNWKNLSKKIDCNIEKEYEEQVLSSNVCNEVNYKSLTLEQRVNLLTVLHLMK